jgi:hypothetical protein
MSRRQILIDALAATPRDLARMLRPLSDADARRRPAPDAWCIAEVVAHLGYVEERCLARLRQVVAEANPSVEYIEDPGGHAIDAPLAELLETFSTRRAATVAFLGGLDQRDWGRPLVHATIGPTRLRDQVQTFVAHDNEHLEEILAQRERLE